MLARVLPKALIYWQLDDGVTEMSTIAEFLARNVTDARANRNLSQSQLAEQSGVPRSTITHIESGQGNPSVANLARIAAALGVGLDELVSEPRHEHLLIKAADVPTVVKSAGRVSVGKLLPDQIKGLEIDRMTWAPRAAMRGTPHVQGTKEYLHCLAGIVQVQVGSHRYTLEPGDVLAFAGDQRHSYLNAGDVEATAISVVVPLPIRLAAD
ncbi:MAG: transcriptional regulator [Lysobacteraceae bacterium]|nr:MAG: transcriptional regulator [Xanthomonadaceae bacterium]